MQSDPVNAGDQNAGRPGVGAAAPKPYQRVALQPWAVRVTRGRLHDEAPSGTRSPWQRDRDRVIHSAAFRKLQYKTQVFVNHEGDFFRTRLTHTLEVAQIARSIARELGVDEDLTEALALAHDLGHPPFGHAGEDGLNAGMRPYGGFSHNAQSLRTVTRLETRYAAFDGLNLTWETLEGLAKHNGPLAVPPAGIKEYDTLHCLQLRSYASVEAQVAAASDDIAYHSHDLDDGLRAGLFGIGEAAELPVVGDAFLQARRASPGVAGERLRHETIRRVINALVVDMVGETRRRVAGLAPADVDAIRAAAGPVVGFSAGMEAANRAIKAFLRARMYRHWRVNRMSLKARTLTEALFEVLHAHTDTLPDGWREAAGEAGSAQAAAIVSDYVAGMTDRFALEEHRRLTDLSIPG